MNWTCQQFEERLTDYLDDALSVADRSAFLAHEAGGKEIVDANDASERDGERDSSR